MGLLVGEDAKRWRNYFDEMAKLIGIEVYYQYPLKDKHYTDHSELKSNYSDMIKTDVIFEEFPKQQTLRKLGWYSEGTESQPMIQCSWGLPEIQQGALFIIPSGIDKAKGRLFRVTKLTNEMQFPANCYCSLVPEFETNNHDSQQNYTDSNFNYLKDDEYDE